jgi:2-methylisocitrate lyase-like PEP mutase family enzyme
VALEQFDMLTQSEKGRVFRALHEREGAFIIPNPWDAGSALLLTRLGFEALATTSAGFAFSLGKRDYAVDREAMIAHVGAIAAAVDVPVSGDLANGFGDSPEAAAETIRLAATAGLVGGSIEDSTGRDGDPIYAFDHAVERVSAAVEAARALPFPFTLTARAENYLHGRADLDQLEEIAAVLRAVTRPVNVLATAQFDLAALSRLGVKRVSVGSALARAAYGGFLRAAEEMRSKGTFRFAEEAVSYRELSGMF